MFSRPFVTQLIFCSFTAEPERSLGVLLVTSLSIFALFLSQAGLHPHSPRSGPPNLRCQYSCGVLTSQTDHEGVVNGCEGEERQEEEGCAQQVTKLNRGIVNNMWLCYRSMRQTD